MMLGKEGIVKRFFSMKWRFVIVGVLVYLMLFAVILYSVQRYAGELWATTWADVSPDLVNQIQAAGRRLVITMFAIIFPFWLAGAYLFSGWITRPFVDLATEAEAISINGRKGASFLAPQNRKMTSDELDRLRRVLANMVESMEATDELFRSIVQNQRELIHRWRPDLSISFVNQAFCDFFGQPADYWLTTPPAELGARLMKGYPEIFKVINSEILQLSPDDPDIVNETFLTMPDGTSQWIIWHTTAIFDKQGQITECQSIGHNLTDLKRTQLELEGANSRLERLSQALIRSQENERIEVVRFLHDEILGELGKIARSADHSEIDQDRILGMIDQLRNLIYTVRSPMLHYGLCYALEDLVDHLRGLIHSRPFEITMKVSGSDVRFDPEIETQIYRIVQQATNNAIMHSDASLIAIKGTIMPERIELIVEDNGQGIEPAKLDPEYLMTEKHYGIIGMEERCKIIGASLQIETQADLGTGVVISWPASGNQNSPNFVKVKNGDRAS